MGKDSAAGIEFEVIPPDGNSKWKSLWKWFCVSLGWYSNASFTKLLEGI